MPHHALDACDAAVHGSGVASRCRNYIAIREQRSGRPETRLHTFAERSHRYQFVSTKVRRSPRVISRHDLASCASIPRHPFKLTSRIPARSVHRLSGRRLANDSMPGARRQYLLHLQSSLGPAKVALMRQELAGMGAQLGNYIPSHTHLVQAPHSALAAMRRMEGAKNPCARYNHAREPPTVVAQQ